MKFVSSAAIGVALALATGSLALTPAYAAKEKPAKAPKSAGVKLSKEFQAAYMKIDAALKARNAPEAQAAIAAAAPLATSADDKYVLAQTKLQLAQANNDRVLLRTAINEMIGSQSAAIPNLGQLYLNAGLLAYEQKDYADAIAKINAAEQQGANSADGYIFAADASFRQKQTPAGLTFAKKAIEATKAAGKPADISWFLRARGAAYQAGMTNEGAEWSRMMISAFPTKENWHDAIAFHLNATKPQDEMRADMFRLMNEMDVMISRDEVRELGDLLVKLQSPGEAKAVIDRGIAKKLVAANDMQVAPLIGTINGMIGADKASLSKGDASARAADRGSITSRWAGAFMGYGDNAKAAELYRLALTKGQVDANAVNFRLGLVLNRLGQTAASVTAFEAAKGPYEALGKLAAQYVQSAAKPVG